MRSLGDTMGGAWDSARNTLGAKNTANNRRLGATWAGTKGLFTGGFRGASEANKKYWEGSVAKGKRQQAEADAGWNRAAGVMQGGALRGMRFRDTLAAGTHGLFTGGFRGAGDAADRAWNRLTPSIRKQDSRATAGRQATNFYDNNSGNTKLYQPGQIPKPAVPNTATPSAYPELAAGYDPAATAGLYKAGSELEKIAFKNLLSRLPSMKKTLQLGTGGAALGGGGFLLGANKGHEVGTREGIDAGLELGVRGALDARPGVWGRIKDVFSRKPGEADFKSLYSSLGEHKQPLQNILQQGGSLRATGEAWGDATSGIRSLLQR